MADCHPVDRGLDSRGQGDPGQVASDVAFLLYPVRHSLQEALAQFGRNRFAPRPYLLRRRSRDTPRTGGLPGLEAGRLAIVHRPACSAAGTDSQFPYSRKLLSVPARRRHDTTEQPLETRGWWHCPQTVLLPRNGRPGPLSADSGTIAILRLRTSADVVLY